MFVENIANLWLVRGPYAYLGAGWSGCNKRFERPPQFDIDVGEPLGFCAETAAGSGVFSRSYTKVTVSMDCATFTPTIINK